MTSSCSRLDFVLLKCDCRTSYKNDGTVAVSMHRPRETSVNAHVIRPGKQISIHNVDSGATKQELSAYFMTG